MKLLSKLLLSLFPTLVIVIMYEAMWGGLMSYESYQKLWFFALLVSVVQIVVLGVDLKRSSIPKSDKLIKFIGLVSFFPYHYFYVWKDFGKN